MIGRAAVIGASGYVGRHLLAELGERGVGAYLARPAPGLVPFDLTRDALAGLSRTGGEPLTHVFLVGGIANPERCAREPQETRRVNVEGVVRLAEDAIAAGIAPVYLSSDYVFAGDIGGYREFDPTAPTTEYGRQKAEAEVRLAAAGPVLVARLSKVVGLETGVHSIIGQWCAEIRTGAPIRAARDQVFSPGMASNIARALADLADAGQTGVWHVAGPEPLSRYDLARMLADEITQVAPEVRIDLAACSLDDIPFAERRPHRTWLNVDKLAAFLPWPFRSMRTVCAEAARLHFAEGGPRRL